MKKGFSLGELLVVIVIIILLFICVVLGPMGSSCH